MKHKKKAAEIHTVGFGDTAPDKPGDILFLILSDFNKMGIDKPELRIRLEQHHPRGGKLEWKQQFNVFCWNRVNKKNECVASSWDINEIREWIKGKIKSE